MGAGDPCKMEYVCDQYGKEVLLKEGKYQVMMEWEKPYMEACIDALRPDEDVLEIGFGCGYSATRIQQYHPKSHTIIEYHPVVAQKAREWAKQYPNVTIIEGTWQDVLSSLGCFDAIFFDDYPLESEQEMNRLEKDREASHELVQKGNALLQGIQQSFPFLNELIYSDADLDQLVQYFLEDKSLSVQHLSQFLKELQARKQITEGQASRVVERLKKAGISVEARPVESMQGQQPFQFRGPNERLLTFLQDVLNHHMRIGSRFSCFLSSSTSKYQDPKFAEEIICNPLLDFTEQSIDIEVPDNCGYYSEQKALVIVITKMG